MNAKTAAIKLLTAKFPKLATVKHITKSVIKKYVPSFKGDFHKLAIDLASENVIAIAPKINEVEEKVIKYFDRFGMESQDLELVKGRSFYKDLNRNTQELYVRYCGKDLGRLLYIDATGKWCFYHKTFATLNVTTTSKHYDNVIIAANDMITCYEKRGRFAA